MTEEVSHECMAMAMAERTRWNADAPSLPSAIAAQMFRAAVFGSTGATGRELVRELAESKSCEKVHAITRRPVEDLSQTFPGTTEESRKKIVIFPVDFENLSETVGKAAEVDVAFCCLGTTHGDAGGAKGFRKVDLTYVLATGEVCRSAGVSNFHLVTAAGVYRSLPRFVSNYVWTKARSEEGILKLGFASCAIWHPGFLDRGDLTRKGESWAKFFGACGLPVSTLAKSMRVYAEQLAAGKRDAKAEDVIENKGIRALAA